MHPCIYYDGICQKLVHTATTAVFPPHPQPRETGGECWRIILASLASKLKQAHILASKELDGPLCQYCKGSFGSFETQSVSDKYIASYHSTRKNPHYGHFMSEQLELTFANRHAVTLVIRTYEAIAAQLYDKVTLDKLTMDPLLAARKWVSKHPDANHNTQTQMVTAKYMFHITL
jgi:hypothetical protein